MAGELTVERDSETNLYVIKNREIGGSLPKPLRGFFTKPDEAHRAIRSVSQKIRHNAKPAKRQANAKTANIEQGS